MQKYCIIMQYRMVQAVIYEHYTQLFIIIAYRFPRYIKQNNLTVYDNQIHITKSSHFYLQLFIAYKLLIDKYINIVKLPIKLVTKPCNNMIVNNICRKYNVDKEMFMQYNKWILKSRVPKNNRCKAIIPYHCK